MEGYFQLLYQEQRLCFVLLLKKDLRIEVAQIFEPQIQTALQFFHFILCLCSLQLSLVKHLHLKKERNLNL